jgi:hypothetical protein
VIGNILAMSLANAAGAAGSESDGGQTKKIPAGTFHFEPPFTSFGHLVGEREQLCLHVEAERLGGHDTEHQLVLGWQSTGNPQPNDAQRRMSASPTALMAPI